MPELAEVESYRRLAEGIVGKTIAEVEAPDAWFLKRGTTAESLSHALVRRKVTGTRRIGKLLLLDTAGGVLGLRFGMTGRLAVDGTMGIDTLLYSSSAWKPEWERFGLRFRGGSHLVIVDPRRLGGVELDPVEDALGVDARVATTAQVGAALRGSSTALKARLLDQKRLAGIGNLMADEILWQAKLSPVRPAGELAPAELRRLQTWISTVTEAFLTGGGSHSGELQSSRHRGSTCPRCRTDLRRDIVGTRTTYWCPRCQR